MGMSLAINGCSVSKTCSSGSLRSSWSFSPGRMPTTLIGMSTSILAPDSSIMRRASSRIDTGSPISSMKMSPPSKSSAACRTSWTASWTLMKNRVMRGSVTVTGPPEAIDA